MSRIFGLDAQLLFDLLISGIAVFVMFMLLSYLLFDPVRKAMVQRQEKIALDIEMAEAEKIIATELKDEYQNKLNEVKQEATDILSNARATSVKRDSEMLNNAKEEVERIKNRANKDIELERHKVMSQIKDEVVTLASIMSEKFISTSLDNENQEAIVNETLEGIGEHTWQEQ